MGFNARGITAWMDHYQSIAYMGFTDQNNSALRISKLDGDPNYFSQAGLLNSNIAVDATGQLLFFLKTNPAKLMTLDIGTKQIKAALPDVILPTSPEMGFYPYSEFQIAAQQTGEQLVLYNNIGTYMINQSSGQICEIVWNKSEGQKQWAGQIQWSPDGRFLAAFVMAGDLPVHYINLVILDTSTGEEWKIELGKPRDMYALAWSPNNRNFVFVAKEPVWQQPEKIIYNELYLADAITKTTKQLLTGYPFQIGTGNSNISWSPDGKMIALNSGIKVGYEVHGQLCFVKIEEMK